MKPTLKSLTERGPILVMGAHPDDIELGCGGVVALETQVGRAAHFVICSDGEAATHGSPRQRRIEAKKAAGLLGASLQWLALDGDARLEMKAAHAIALARIIRVQRPEFVLAPSLAENQHPDHWRLGRLARDAARIARYGGVKELRALAPHRISQLFYYALTAASEPRDLSPLLIDVSAPSVLAAWTAAMQAHRSQMSAHNYIDMQLLRARLHGESAGVRHAMALFPNDPPLLTSLAQLGRGARQY
ncbi:MAG TPA: PIG-L family deacetylase [Verrucomicrobiae bacterium]|jgi:LmbE family N-acetylglucosaminyl deacetylase|nr:PIG-L family deacetylase [Verrucomicrobiae bacterium]